MAARVTREEAIARAAKSYAAGLLAQEQMTPREQAEAAYQPASRFTVDELEELIRVTRGLPPLRLTAGHVAILRRFEVTREVMWMSVRDVVDESASAPDAVRLALRAGELHGHRRHSRGRWAIHRTCFELWNGADSCIHAVDGTDAGTEDRATP